MSWLTTSIGRSFRILATAMILIAVTGLIAVQVASATYEGTDALLAYHEGNTAENWVMKLAEDSEHSWWSFSAPKAGAYTTPSVSNTCASCEANDYTAAVNAESGYLWVRPWSTGTWSNTGLGYAAHTSPSAHNLFVAFHAAGSEELWLYNAWENLGFKTGLGMATESSPSLTEDSTARHVAFSGLGSNSLWIYTNPLYTTGGTGFNTGLGVAPGTSPAITEVNGTIYVAFNSYATNHLWIYNASTNSGLDTGLGLTASSSPSIINWGGYLVAFEAAGSNHLGLYQNGQAGWHDMGVTMQPGSSPSITKRLTTGMWRTKLLVRITYGHTRKPSEHVIRAC